jgi:photosystem II stability/assembly factor-like uncharacterized protein
MNMKQTFFAGVALLLLAAGCNPFASPPQAGILKTENGGMDWAFFNTVKGTPQTSLSGSDISVLLFEPGSTSSLLAGSYNSGLLRSEDSGVTWESILSKVGIYDVAQSSRDPKIIFAAGTVGGHGKVLKTGDQGKSWQEVYNEESQNNTVRSIAMNPANNQELALGLASGNLVGTQDGGGSWKLLTNFDDQINRVRWQAGGLYVLLKTEGVMRSTDNGAHFVNLTAPLRPQNSFSNLLESQDTGSFNQFALDSTGAVIYLTAEKGLFATRDGGAHWQNMSLPVRDKKVIVRSVALASGSLATVYVSAGATIYKTTNSGDSWQTQGIKTNGFINALLVHPTLPQVAYAGVYVGGN